MIHHVEVRKTQGHRNAFTQRITTYSQVTGSGGVGHPVAADSNLAKIRQKFYKNHAKLLKK